MKLLEQADLGDLVNAAMTAGLSRDALNAGIDRRYLSSVPLVADLKGQCLSDLVSHNDVGSLNDGRAPLEQWLVTALLLASPRSEADIFLRHLNRVRKVLGNTAAGRGTAATPYTPVLSVTRSIPAWREYVVIAATVIAILLVVGTAVSWRLRPTQGDALDQTALRDCRDRLRRVSTLSKKQDASVESVRQLISSQLDVCLSTLEGATHGSN